MKKRILSFIILFALVMGNFSFPVEAKTLKLSYNGKTVNYSGKQLKLTCDGSNISLTKTPGILMGSAGYAMLPYYEAFVKSNIKATKKYYSSTKKLYLTYNSNTLQMTLNSRTAYLNGTKVTLPVAPIMVTYNDYGVTRILVPSRAVASYLDIQYEWKSALSTVAISSNTTSNIVSTASTSTSAPTSYIYNGETYSISKRNVVYNGSAISLTSTPALTLGGYNMVPYHYTFVKNGPKIKKSYSSKTKQLVLTSTLNGNKNVLTMKVNSKTASLNGKKVTLPKAPVFIKFSKKGSNIIYVPAKAVGTLLGFSYSYTSSTKRISYTPGLSIKISGSSYSVYTRTQVAVMAGSSKISTKIPGILVNNTTLIPASATFKSKYGLGVTYTYSNKKATFKRGSNTVIVTMNSSIASVNGTNKSMTVAARLIYLPSTKTNYVMVPGEFVTEALGLTYQYSSGTAHISIPSSSTGSSTAGTSDDSVVSSDSDFKATITLSRPSSVSKGTITCTDDYANKALLIVMSGDQRSYYSSNKPSLPSGVTFSTSYSSSTGKTTLSFKTSTINGFKVKEEGSNIYIQNGTPSTIYKNIIVLDAGHGGSDSGATGNGYKEKDFTLSIVKAAKTYFDNNSDYKVYYTRLTDTYPSLSDRYKLANEVNADMFISVHINSAGSTATGTETLYNPDRNKKSDAGLTCYQLASYVHKYIQASTGFSDRGLKQRCTRLSNGLAVLNNNNGPATLTEIGFISNASEAKKMAANLTSYGKALYNAVVYTTSKYPTKR
ncbi:MAG: N-acetylmuramoyl-L-alanine amidase [Lachnospiraceae bacterium]|nr:N-acetylmuramoyl-L-alanine amidase [Lachnospiraceae bacterium]